MFHLGTNPDVQEKLFNEAKKILPNYDSDVIDATILNNEATYTRAVLKESLRLNPIAIGVGRILNNDMVLSNYLIPKGVSTDRSDFEFFIIIFFLLIDNCYHSNTSCKFT